MTVHQLVVQQKYFEAVETICKNYKNEIPSVEQIMSVLNFMTKILKTKEFTAEEVLPHLKKIYPGYDGKNKMLIPKEK